MTEGNVCSFYARIALFLLHAVMPGLHVKYNKNA